MPEEKKKIGAGFGVILLKDGKALLGHRHEDSVKASSALHGEGTWTLPGGKLDFGESFEDGAAREVKEETGIEIEGVKIICVSNDRVEDAHFVTIGMLAEIWKGEAQVLEPDEITEWQWFDLKALPKPLFFPSAEILKNFSEGKFYQDFK